MKSTVAVVGAGLVGTTAALALAHKGFAVTLIDRQAPVVNSGVLGMDIRNVALSPASQQLLSAVGVWPEQHAAVYQRMVVWEQWGKEQLVFAAADVQRAELGWLVEMSPLGAALWAACEQPGDIQIQCAEVQSVELDDGGVSLSTVDRNNALSQHRFDFLIAADGARSTIRTALGLGVVKTPANQVALATVIKTERPHQHTAWQRFLLDGPLALLPGPQPHLCSVVWSQSPQAAERRMQLSDEEFQRDISIAAECRLGAVAAVDRRTTFPLTQQRVQNCYPHRRVLLIGDAMRVVHPLAGLGVNLGFEDVQQLVNVAAQQQDLAFDGLWRRFARQRQARSAAMITTLDMLKRFYSLSGPSATLLRNTGISAFNALPGLKRQVMNEAMGLGPLSGR